MQAQNALVVVPFPVGAAFNLPIGRVKREHVPFGVVRARNPTLMRLRELEVLEQVATSGKLNVVLGEKGLAERVVNLL